MNNKETTNKKSILDISSRSKKVITKEQPQSTKDSSLEEGLNLMPSLTKEEIQKEEKKAFLNVGSAFSLLSLVILSVFIVAFNIFSKIELNTKREELYEYEAILKKNGQSIVNNNDILDRIFLYKDIETSTFSPKEVIEYIEHIAEKSGGIDISAYDIGDDLDFEFTGESQDLEKVSKFWYLLCDDNAVEIVNLDSINKTASGTTFSFSGELKFDNFVSLSDEND